jgi:hypothetical protein
LVFNLSVMYFSVIVQRLPQRGYWPLVKSWQDVRGLWKPSDKVFGRCLGIFTTRQQILWRIILSISAHDTFLSEYCPYPLVICQRVLITPGTVDRGYLTTSRNMRKRLAP